MPSLVCCKKRWNAGTDDFVIPAFLAIVVRIPWLLMSVAVLVVQVQITDSVCLSFIQLLTSYNVSHLIVQLAILGLEAAIMCTSARGSVMETQKRRNLPIILIFRSCLFFAESAVIIFGTILLSPLVQSAISRTLNKEHYTCYREEKLVKDLTIVLIVLSWLLQTIIVIFFFYYVDLCGVCLSPMPINKDQEDGVEIGENDKQLLLTARELRRRTVMHHGRARASLRHQTVINFGQSTKRLYHYQSIQQRQWLKKFRKLCCNSSGGSLKALNDLAASLAIMLEDSDYVVSDIVAALKLVSELHHKTDGFYQREVEYMRKLTMSQLGKRQLSTSYTYTPPRPLDFSNHDERATFVTGMYYLKYAVGIYGWPIHLFLNPFCGICQLASHLRCCCCKLSAPEDIQCDNPCSSNYAAFMLETGSNSTDILYCSFSNDLYSSPFAVICDHSKKSIVITVRGSLSLKDILTDLTVSLRKITIDEEPYSEMDTYIHVGVHSTAVTIKNILSDKEILSRAFSEHPDYSLVIVGHSLGAGAATALGIILREFFPNLTCYTYSPVGCAFSYPVMEYTKKFVTSFVVGNDLISRTTLRSLIHLCSWMSRLLRHTQRPKYQIVLGSWLNCCSSRDSHSSFPIVHRPRNLSSILFSVYCAKKFGRIWQNKTRKGYVHNFQKYIKKEILFPTFAAGRIILMEMEDSNSTTICCNQEEAGMSVLWYPNEDLGVIRIGNGTIDHHVPNEVIAAFNTVKRQFSLLPDS